MIACYARHCQTVCAALRRWCHSTPDVIRPCVLLNGHNGIPCSTSSDRVCCPKVMITCYTQCRFIMYTFQGQWWYAKVDVVLSCVLSKGNDGMPRRTSSDPVYAIKKGRLHAMPYVIRPCGRCNRNDGMPRPTSSDHVCCPRAMMACHTWHSLIVCDVQGWWYHAMLDVLRPCALSKG